MFEGIIVVFHQVLEVYAEDGLKGIFRPRFFRNRKATPVELDLSLPISLFKDFLQDSDHRFIELKMNELSTGRLSFAVPSRCFKALRNLKRGLRCFALVEGATIVGDVWCATLGGPGNLVTHPDLKMLGINCKEKEVYAFDMLIAPRYRGKNFAVPLQRFLHLSLNNEGFRKVYGFYWDDNLPALWMHRMLKYKELPKRNLSRFFFLHQYRNAGSV